MMDRKILGLAVIAVMMLMAFFQLQENESNEETGGAVLPGLKKALESASELTVESAGSTVSVVKQDGVWIVREKSGYAADFEVVSRVLNSLADVQVAERKTARPGNHVQLGVELGGDDPGLQISILANDSFDLVIGDDSPSRGSFVRRMGEDQVYLTDKVLDVSAASIDYVEDVFLNIASSEVQAVEVAKANAVLSAKRDESGEMRITNLPDGAELRYETVADGLARMFVNLRFTDVAPYDSGFFIEPTKTTVTFGDGESRVVRSEQRNEAYWAHIDETWQFQISEYTFNELNKSMSDMLKEVSIDE